MTRVARAALAVTLAVLLDLAPALPALAQSYPARPVHLLVGQAPGGHSDVIGRIIAQRLGEILKQPVVVENRGGAGGTIAAEAVARSPADGYTLLFAGSNNLGLALLVIRDLRYTAQDFASVGAIARVPYALAVHPRVPARNLAELVAYAQAHPGKLNYATSGPGSMSGLGFEMLKRAAGIDMVAIPYKGSGPAAKDLVAGQVDMAFTDLSMLASLAGNGSVRLIAVASTKRSDAVADVATVTEQGHPELAIEPWYGLAAPAGTPRDVVARLNDALRRALRSPDVRGQFDRLGFTPIESTPEELDAIIEREVRTFEALIDPDLKARR